MRLLWSTRQKIRTTRTVVRVMSNDTVAYDCSFLYDEDASESDVVDGYQYLIDTGQAWRLEGHVGRTAMAMIESGLCMLGKVGHRDYWGNYVPSRTEVKAGSKGSAEYAQIAQEERSTGR